MGLGRNGEILSAGGGKKSKEGEERAYMMREWKKKSGMEGVGGRSGFETEFLDRDECDPLRLRIFPRSR